MHDDKTRIELVFNPRKMSVAMVKAELAKRPDLTIDELKMMLAGEGSAWITGDVIRVDGGENVTG